MLLAWCRWALLAFLPAFAPRPSRLGPSKTFFKPHRRRTWPRPLPLLTSKSRHRSSYYILLVPHHMFTSSSRPPRRRHRCRHQPVLHPFSLSPPCARSRSSAAAPCTARPQAFARHFLTCSVAPLARMPSPPASCAYHAAIPSSSLLRCTQLRAARSGSSNQLPEWGQNLGRVIVRRRCFIIVKSPPFCHSFLCLFAKHRAISQSCRGEGEGEGEVVGRNQNMAKLVELSGGAVMGCGCRNRFAME